MIRTIVFAALLGELILGSTVHAQQVHGKPDVWFQLVPKYKINDNWSVGNEFQMRFDDYLSTKQQFLIRPFVNYKTKKNPNILYTLGYTFARTHPYGDYPLPDVRPEHNVWEQITLKQQVGKTAISSRFRLEERWLGNLSPDANEHDHVNGYSYANRFRYRLTLIRPLNDKFFVTVFNEIWIKTNKKFKATQYDRNWFYVGLGRHITKHLDLQLAYMNQYVMNNPDLYERHHTLKVSGSILF